MTEDLCFIRCFTCGRVLANKWDAYQELLMEGKQIGEALNILGIRSYCCRRLMMCPAKIACNVDRQVTAFEDTCPETLTVATGNRAPILAPLEAMRTRGTGTRETGTPELQVPPVSRAPVVPAPMGQPAGGMFEITLPEIPVVAVPSIPAPGAEVVTEKVNRIIRSYSAW